MAPVGNNTKNRILITAAQFQEENQKTLKAKYLQTKKTKNNNKKKKTKQKEKNKPLTIASRNVGFNSMAASASISESWWFPVINKN